MGTLSSVDLSKIYLSLKDDPDISIFLLSCPNDANNDLDMRIEYHANNNTNVGISKSLLELMTTDPQNPQDIQTFLGNQVTQANAITNYRELTDNLPLSFIFYLIDSIHDFGNAANNNAVLKDWFVYMVTKQLLINYVEISTYSKYLDINSINWNAFFTTPENMPKIIINSLDSTYFANNFLYINNALAFFQQQAQQAQQAQQPQLQQLQAQLQAQPQLQQLQAQLQAQQQAQLQAQKQTLLYLRLQAQLQAQPQLQSQQPQLQQLQAQLQTDLDAELLSQPPGRSLLYIQIELIKNKINNWDNSKSSRDINKNISRGLKSQAIYNKNKSNMIICTENSLDPNHWSKIINADDIDNLFDFRIIAYKNKDIAFKSELLTSIQKNLAGNIAENLAKQQNQLSIGQPYAGFVCDNGFSSLSWIGGLEKTYRSKKNISLMASAFTDSTTNGFSKPIPCIHGCPSLYDNMNDQNRDINNYRIYPDNPPPLPPPGALDYALRQQAIFSLLDPITNYEITGYQWRGTKNYFITKEYHAIFGMERLTIQNANFNVEWRDFRQQLYNNSNITYSNGKQAKLNKLKNTILKNLNKFGNLIRNKMYEAMFGNNWINFVYEYMSEPDNTIIKFRMKMKILNMILDMKRSGDYIQSYAVKINREEYNIKYIFTTGDVVCANISAYLHDNPTIYALSGAVPNMMQFYNIFKTDKTDPWSNTKLHSYFSPNVLNSDEWSNIYNMCKCGANVNNMERDEINQFRNQAKGGAGKGDQGTQDRRTVKKGPSASDKRDERYEKLRAAQRNKTDDRRKYLLFKKRKMDDIGYIELLYNKVVEHLSFYDKDTEYSSYLSEYFIGKIFSLSTEQDIQLIKKDSGVIDHKILALILFDIANDDSSLLELVEKYGFTQADLIITEPELSELLRKITRENPVNNKILLEVDRIINDKLNAEMSEDENSEDENGEDEISEEDKMIEGNKMRFVIQLFIFYKELYHAKGFKKTFSDDLIHLSKLQTISYVFSLPVFQQYYEEYLEDLISEGTDTYTFKDFIFTTEVVKTSIDDKIRNELFDVLKTIIDGKDIADELLKKMLVDLVITDLLSNNDFLTKRRQYLMDLCLHTVCTDKEKDIKKIINKLCNDIKNQLNGENDDFEGYTNSDVKAFIISNFADIEYYKITKDVIKTYLIDRLREDGRELNEEMLDMLSEHIYYSCEHIIKKEIDRRIEREQAQLSEPMTPLSPQYMEQSSPMSPQHSYNVSRTPSAVLLDTEIEYEYELDELDFRSARYGRGGSIKLPLKTIINRKKNILGKERCIYIKYGSKKEYVKYKGELILIKDFIKYYSSKPTTKSATKHATKPTTKPTTNPTYKPTKPTTKPTSKPTKPTKPTSKPTTKSTYKPTKPTTKPTTKSTTKPATKPTTKPTDKPVTKPVTKPATKPATKPTKPVTKPYNTKELKEIAKKNNIKVTKKIEDKYVTLNKKELISKLKKKKLI